MQLVACLSLSSLVAARARGNSRRGGTHGAVSCTKLRPHAALTPHREQTKHATRHPIASNSHATAVFARGLVSSALPSYDGLPSVGPTHEPRPRSRALALDQATHSHSLDSPSRSAATLTRHCGCGCMAGHGIMAVRSRRRPLLGSTKAKCAPNVLAISRPALVMSCITHAVAAHAIRSVATN